MQPTAQTTKPRLPLMGTEKLEWNEVLHYLKGQLRTPQGLATWTALTPCANAQQATLHMQASMAWAAWIAKGRAPAPTPLEDCAPLIENAARGGLLQVEDLQRVRTFLQSTSSLAKALGVHGQILATLAQPLPTIHPVLIEVATGFEPLEPLLKILEKALTPNGLLNPGTFPSLQRLQRSIERHEQRISQALQQKLGERGLKDALQDNAPVLRNGRAVLAIKSDFRGRVRGLLHGASASGATVFIEPEEAMNQANELALAQEALIRECMRICADLSKHIGQHTAALRGNLAWLGRMDLLHASANMVHAYHGETLEWSTENQLNLRLLAHPLLLLHKAQNPQNPQNSSRIQESVIRNDFHLPNNVLCAVISGPNAGGKTVLLKAVGLAVLLALHGFPPPVGKGSCAPWFAGGVWAFLGDQQNLADSLSTFSAQVAFLAHMLSVQKAPALTLLDEPFGATDPMQGAALAQALLERFLANHIHSLVTTHLPSLKAFAQEHPQIVNASLLFDLNYMRPTHRLRFDQPGASAAIPMAKRSGMPAALLERAECLLDAQGSSEKTLLNLEGREAAILVEEERLQALRTHLTQGKAKLAQQNQVLEARQRDLRKEARQKAEKEWGEVRQQAKTVLAELKTLRQQHATQATLQQAERLDKESKVVQTQLQNQAREQRREAAIAQARIPVTNANVLSAGAKVYLPSLAREGVFEKALDEGKKARIRFGSMHLNAVCEDMLYTPVTHAASTDSAKNITKTHLNKPHPTPPNNPAQPSLVLAGKENVLNVRGMRFEEALEATERFLDESIRKNETQLLLIHGHGTGVLKTGLRKHFAKHPLVQSLRPGLVGEGNDGVSVMVLV